MPSNNHCCAALKYASKRITRKNQRETFLRPPALRDIVQLKKKLQQRQSLVKTKGARTRKPMQDSKLPLYSLSSSRPGRCCRQRYRRKTSGYVPSARLSGVPLPTKKVWDNKRMHDSLGRRRKTPSTRAILYHGTRWRGHQTTLFLRFHTRGDQLLKLKINLAQQRYVLQCIPGACHSKQK